MGHAVGSRGAATCCELLGVVALPGGSRDLEYNGGTGDDGNRGLEYGKRKIRR